MFYIMYLPFLNVLSLFVNNKQNRVHPTKRLHCNVAVFFRGNVLGYPREHQTTLHHVLTLCSVVYRLIENMYVKGVVLLSCAYVGQIERSIIGYVLYACVSYRCLYV